MRSTPYKFGAGVTADIGDDLAALGTKRVLVVTDTGVAKTGIPRRVVEAIEAKGIVTSLYDEVRVEPSDVSTKGAPTRSAI